jgi:hypothetical protein
MGQLTDRLRSLSEKAAKLPPDTVPQAEIAARFDPSQYSYTKPVREVLDNVLAELTNFQAQTSEDEFESAPIAVRNEFLGNLVTIERNSIKRLK